MLIQIREVVESDPRKVVHAVARDVENESGGNLRRWWRYA